MPISDEQRATLTAEANRRGIDPAKLIAAASDEGAPAEGEAAAASERPLYMYHLPFVTVNEVRTGWLGLKPVPGGEQYAGEWAAERAGSVQSKPGSGKDTTD